MRIFLRNLPVIQSLKRPPLRHLSSLASLRNIGISAHIDSGKTTLTERILFYTGRIRKIHEVRGKDGVGAKMDSMELEREKGITIKSAATFTRWGGTEVNIIDTPGHVDFTIEVERSMRVLDGAILVVCGASAVQSQTITVNRQMNRYSVPRIAFINKLDRQGSNAVRTSEAIKKKLKLNSALVQLPVGSEENFVAIIDLLEMEIVHFEGTDGSTVVRSKIPENLLKNAIWHRSQLIEALANVDSELEDKFLMEEEPTKAEIKAAIRRATIAMKFVPIFVGSAVKNKGVQPLLDGVESYLPAPNEVRNYALQIIREKTSTKTRKKGVEEKALKEGGKVEIEIDQNKPLLCLAFKLEESKYGQLTWVRMYQGVLKKGDYIYNISKSFKRLKVNRLVKMHSDEIVDIDKIKAGEIAALFGVDCDSGTTFGSSDQSLILTSMKVPETVISLAVELKDARKSEKFSRALKRFQREDPTFKVSVDEESKDLVLSGMGELHLEIYLERLRREYDTDTKTSPPQVNFRERITSKVPFNYQYKKQTGGQGMYAKIIGYIEPIPETDAGYPHEFISLMKGLTIPPEFIASIKKAFLKGMNKGPLVGAPLQGVRFVLEDGVTHEVDSSDLSFAMATKGALREALPKAEAILYEPVMEAEITAPLNFQSAVVSGLSRRSASIKDLQRLEESVVIKANVPLEEMFGYASDLRGCTEGKGEFSMEYLCHEQTSAFKQKRLVREKLNKNKK